MSGESVPSSFDDHPYVQIHSTETRDPPRRKGSRHCESNQRRVEGGKILLANNTSSLDNSARNLAPKNSPDESRKSPSSHSVHLSTINPKKQSNPLTNSTTGCAATCYALYRAYRSMRAGDSAEMNRMFRARIYAQAFTLVALVAGGMYYKAERKQRREFDQAVEERKGQEKRDAWLRELEIRDEEDREWRERHAAIEAAAKDGGKKVEKKVEQPDAARAAIEPADEKSVGVLDAVKVLLASRK